MNCTLCLDKKFIRGPGGKLVECPACKTDLSKQLETVTVETVKEVKPESVTIIKKKMGRPKVIKE